MTAEFILTIVLVLALAGTIIPLLPGIGLMFVSTLVYGFFDHWESLSPWFVAGIGGATILAFGIDYAGSAIGAKKFGATKYGIWGAMLGGIVGMIFLGPPGVLLGPIIGVLAVEILGGKSLDDAIRCAIGVAIGVAGGAIVQFALALVIFIWVMIKIY